MPSIYKITSPTGKVYIGSTLDSKRRFYQYSSLNCESQPKLYNSFRKHGVDNHTFEILIECSTQDMLRLEAEYGAQFDVLGANGLNCALPTNTLYPMRRKRHNPLFEIPPMTPEELTKFRNLRAAAIKRARISQGITKKKLFELSGISRQTIDRIENNTGPWGADVEMILIHELGMAHFQPVYKEENGKTVIVEMVLMPKK